MTGKGIIPEWADKKAERVMTMFTLGDTLAIDRALLHGAFAAALCEERERCAKIAEPPLMHRVGRIGLWRRRRAEIAAAIRGGGASKE